MVGYVYWRFPRTMSWGTIVVTSWLIMCYCVIDVAAFPSSNATNRGEDSIITRMRRQSWRLQKRQLLASADPQQEKAKSLEEAVFGRVGGTTKMQCLPVVHDGHYTNPTYEWRDGANRTLANPRFVVKKTGNLVINDIQPEDSDQYICLVRGKDGQNAEFQHQLLSYTMPKTQLTAQLLYTLLRRSEFGDMEFCSDEYARSKATELADNLCGKKGKSCIYHIQGHCLKAKDDPITSPSMKIQISVVPPRDYKPPSCDALCMKRAVEKLLRKEFARVLELESTERKTYQKIQWLSPNTKSRGEREVLTDEITDTFKRTFVAAGIIHHLGLRYEPKLFVRTMSHSCVGGYRAYTFICLPCDPGTYSMEGAANCDMCPKNHYQDHYAMEKCYPCPGKKLTKDIAADSGDLCLEDGELVFTVDITKKNGVMAGAIAGGVLGGIALLVGICIALLMKWPNEIRAKLIKKKNPENDQDIMDLHNQMRQILNPLEGVLPIIPEDATVRDTPSSLHHKRSSSHHSRYKDVHHSQHSNVHMGPKPSTVQHEPGGDGRGSKTAIKYKYSSHQVKGQPSGRLSKKKLQHGSRAEMQNANNGRHNSMDVGYEHIYATPKKSNYYEEISGAKTGRNPSYLSLKQTQSGGKYGSHRVEPNDGYAQPRLVRSKQSTRGNHWGDVLHPATSQHVSCHQTDSAPKMAPPPVPRSSSILRHDEDPMARAVFNTDVPSVPNVPPVPPGQSPLHFSSSAYTSINHTDSGNYMKPAQTDTRRADSGNYMTPTQTDTRRADSGNYMTPTQTHTRRADSGNYMTPTQTHTRRADSGGYMTPAQTNGHSVNHQSSSSNHRASRSSVSALRQQFQEGRSYEAMHTGSRREFAAYRAYSRSGFSDYDVADAVHDGMLPSDPQAVQYSQGPNVPSIASEMSSFVDQMKTRREAFKSDTDEDERKMSVNGSLDRRVSSTAQLDRSTQQTDSHYIPQPPPGPTPSAIPAQSRTFRPVEYPKPGEFAIAQPHGTDSTDSAFTRF